MDPSNETKYVQSISHIFRELEKGFNALEWANVIRQDEENLIFDINGTECASQNYILFSDYTTCPPTTSRQPIDTLHIQWRNALLHLTMDATRKCVLFAAPWNQSFHENKTFKRMADVVVGYTDNVTCNDDTPLTMMTPAWNKCKPFPLIGLHVAHVYPDYLPSTPTKWIVFACFQREERNAIAYGGRFGEAKLYEMTPNL